MGEKGGGEDGEKWHESEQGLKGKEGGKMKGKGWEERGPKAYSKNSDLGCPLIGYSLVALKNNARIGGAQQHCLEQVTGVGERGTVA